MKKIIKTIVALIFITCMFSIISVNAADKYDSFPLSKSDKLKGKIVILDAGHGDETTNSVGSYKEAEFALAEVKLVKQNLENLGATVYLTRSTSKDVYFYERTATVNNWALDIVIEKYKYLLSRGNSAAQNKINELNSLKAHMNKVINDHSKAGEYFNTPYSTTTPISSVLKRIFEYENTPEIYENMIFISIHSNADDSTSTNGTVVYYINNSFADSKNYYTNYSNVKRNEKLATLLCNQVSTAGGFKNRGLLVNDFYMIREINIPSALIEVGFHTNDSDRAKLSSTAYRKRIANGIAYGVVEYFDYYKSSETITPRPTATPKPTATPSPTPVPTATPSPTPVPTDTPVPTEAPPFYKADLNDDGFISAADALIILKHAARLELLEGEKLLMADTTRDGLVDSVDALLTLKYSARLIESEIVETTPSATEIVDVTIDPTDTPGTDATVEPTEIPESTETIEPVETPQPTEVIVSTETAE